MHPEPVAEGQHSVDFSTTCGKDVESPVDTWRFQQAMLEPIWLANPQHETLFLEGRDIGRLVGRIGYSQNHVDYRFCGQSWD